MKDFFKDKFEYNYNSNEKLIRLMETNPEGYSERAKLLISHILNAQNIWNNRIMGTPATQKVWELFDLAELSSLNSKNHNHSLNILEEIDLTIAINYCNSEGKEFSTAIIDILYHIINHSTYHRGQLMSELKSEGLDSVITDFIFYRR